MKKPIVEKADPFLESPPFGWSPKIGDRVAVYIGWRDKTISDVGTVAKEFEVMHHSGQVIKSYRVEFSPTNWLLCSRNSLRPI